MGEVIYGVDFRRHLDRVKTLEEMAIDLVTNILEKGKDAGSLGDTAPSEWSNPDEPA